MPDIYWVPYSRFLVPCSANLILKLRVAVYLLQKMDELEFYVLYCCKKCHRQFQEKIDLMEHYSVCPALKTDAGSIKSSDTGTSIS